MKIASAAHPITTGVCCVEFGRLERQTILMVRSLRAFGGMLSEIPVIAVVGRPGVALRASTIRELHKLGVRIVRADRGTNPATWLNYGNKAAAVMTADKLAETEQVTWFDSDMVFMGEPTGIVLAGNEDLAIAPIDNPPAVYTDDDAHVGYWRRVCSLFDVDFENVPWVSFNGRTFKLNCNSGVFTWRRKSGFASRYNAAFARLLNSRLAQKTGEFFTIDQVILTPLANSTIWKTITLQDHSFSPSAFFEYGTAPSLEGVRILHYSTAFDGPFRLEIERRIAKANPEFHRWLVSQQFEDDVISWRARAVAKALKVYRGMRYRVFAKLVEKID
jgi:hypothetical protein